ncbi:AsmA family protein [Lentisalinibacter sediminis]|uniref:AsmA family protein n=1 Tax=Lentisalinibacter sediminis TaxID=2992237 RepID=UPI0038642486
MRWLAIALAAVVLIFAGALLYLASADLGGFKDRLTPLVSDALGRELRVDGDLSLRLGRTVRLRAADVSVANASWADGPYLLEAEEVAAEVGLRSLLEGPVRVESVVLRGAVIRLQEADDGRRNWSQQTTGESEEIRTDLGGTLETLRSIARFSASDVRFLYAAPYLSSPSQIVVGTAEYGVKGELMSADVSAEVNGIPLVLAAEIAPADAGAAAGGLRIGADARMGDVALTAGVLLADPEVLAISAAELELDGPDIDYVFDVLKLPKVTSGPLSVKAKLTPDPERSGFDAEGRVGEYRFAADGWVEDLRGVGGFDVSVFLAGENLSALGRRFAVEDLPAEPFEVDGRLRSRTDGVEFEDTRIVVGEEQAQVAGSILWPAGGGEELDVSARYRGMSGRVTAAIRRDSPQHDIDFGFSIEGEDAGVPAGRVGLDHLDDLPFAASGEGNYRGRTLSLRGTRIRVGDQQAELTGRAEFVPDAPDVELRFDAERIDLSPWLPDDGPLDPALRTIGGTGLVTLSEGRLAADELDLRAADVALAGRLALPLTEGGRSGEFALHLQAPSAEAIVPGLAGAALAAQPVDLQGEGSWEAGGWRLDDFFARNAASGDVRGSVTFAGGARPAITARLTSERLDLRRDRPAAPAPEPAAADDRFIPAWEIPLARLPDLDAELDVHIASLYGAGMGGETVFLDAALRDGRLIVDRLETRGPRGRIRVSLAVEPDAAPAYVATLKLDGRELYVAPPDEPAASLPERPPFEVAAALTARGATLRELAGGLEGRLKLQMGAGTIPRRGGLLTTLVFEDFLSRTLETINPLIKSRDEVQLNCLVLVAEIEAGAVRGDPMLALQTSEVNVLARGQIDLGSESLNLDIATHPRRGLGVSLGDLINPFTRVGGTLASPRLVADPKSAAFETGAGIATGGVWILAKKLRSRFLSGNPCANALEKHDPETDG